MRIPDEYKYIINGSAYIANRAWRGAGYYSIDTPDGIGEGWYYGNVCDLVAGLIVDAFERADGELCKAVPIDEDGNEI